jgi:hypothetical protein
MFFVREGRPRPGRDLEQAERSLRPYLRWGFFGTEDLAAPKGQRFTLLGASERRRVLEGLLRTRKQLTVGEYMEACGGRVHRRMAERDLQSCPRLRKRGATRGAVYVVRRRAKR